MLLLYSLLLTRDLQHRRNSLVVILQNVPHLVCYMLVNQNDSNIITLSEVFEGILHCFGFGIGFDGEEVGGVGGAVAYSCEEETGDSIL